MSLPRSSGFAVAAASLALVGCFSSPTPLAPGLGGSVGTPSSGVLTGGAPLPRAGLGFRLYRPYTNIVWGNPRLVAALTHAAAVVERTLPGGAPLVIGDLSAERGGKIPRHHSHRTGRDADLLFYVTTPSGAPVQNPGFIRFDADGLAELEDGSFLRLDVPREWLLIKTLLSSSPDVQWLFCSRAIEALIIDYARARGEEPALVWHAETVLLQPGDSLAHDDHLHFRLSCSPEDAVRGCDSGGPHWDWLPSLPSLEALDDDTLAAIAADDPLEPPPAAAGGAAGLL